MVCQYLVCGDGRPWAFFSMKRHFFDAAYRKIPLLFYGDVLKPTYKGQKNNKIGSQTDLAAPYLNQLDLDASAFRWSKNLLNPDCPGFAYYGFDDGLGWIEPHNFFSYHHIHKRNLREQFESELKKDSVEKKGKAYLQILLQEFPRLMKKG